MTETGYPEPGYTQTPNPLFDEHMRLMGEAELRVVLCAVRKTFGYHKLEDGISLTQFQSMTGLSRQGVVDGLEAAIQRGVIRQTGTGRRGVGIYALNVIPTGQASGLVKPVDQSTQLTGTGQASRPELVKPVDTQKKITKEKKQKKKDSAPAAQDADSKVSHKSTASKEPNPLFDVVADWFFGAKPDDKASVRAVAGRTAKLVAYLNTRKGISPERVIRFIAWYRDAHQGIALPNNPASLTKHWTAFEQAQTPVHSNGNGAHRKAFHAGAWVEPARLSPDYTLDGTQRPAWMLAEIPAAGDYGGVFCAAGEKVYHDGSLPLAWQGLE